MARSFKVKRAVAAVAVATALFFLCPPSSWASPSVEGLPSWLRESAERASTAVWSELDNKGLSHDAMADTFALVMGRIFSGYQVELIWRDSDPVLKMTAKDPSHWVVEMIYPEVPEPPISWLREDGEKVASLLGSHLSSIPYQALSWGDEALRSLVSDSLSLHLPGWKGSVVVRLKEDISVIELSVYPSPPLILATYPSIYSGTLPNLLREGLRESLIKDMVPLLGLPVPWVEKHEVQVNRWAVAALERRNTVINSNALVSLSITPGEIARVEGTVDSRRYVLRAWLSAQAGGGGRSPEFGLHLGRIVQVFPNWDWELYGEGILELEDWNLESRWGLRWAIDGPLWLGAEYVAPDNRLWYRLWLEGNVKGPYLWWRYSEDRDNQGALGYRLNQTISLELHYDDRYDDRWSIRAVGDL
ncbi:hypothetical protein [Dethiosulfovibrio salsuginis]|uniref:hypothetical protein n=1 Tax=Dethiosulfovibrio salsuginis TaxID=561720 RepID=UPI0011773585|nr:hypothetical protein [Dethiosulfovibrio salsuginis]